MHPALVAACSCNVVQPLESLWSWCALTAHVMLPSGNCWSGLWLVAAGVSTLPADRAVLAEWVILAAISIGKSWSLEDDGPYTQPGSLPLSK